MDPNRLETTLADLRSRGIPIVAVSAAACATPIGAFDPLEEIADVCRRHEVWLHVDAAHGGALAFSDRHRHLIAGIERADTVVCDAHKMMFMPALCAMLFYRNPAHRRAAFHQEAPYLFDPLVPELAEYDSGVANLECTKRAAAFGVWGVWSLFGPQIFADMVDVTIELAVQFHEMLAAADDFETLHEPQCNIVAFRYLPSELRNSKPEEVDLFQLRLAACGNHIRRILPSAKPARRPTGAPDDDDEPAHDGKRPAGAYGMPTPHRQRFVGRPNPQSATRNPQFGLAVSALANVLGGCLDVRTDLALIHLLAQVSELRGWFAAGWLLRLRHFLLLKS